MVIKKSKFARWGLLFLLIISSMLTNVLQGPNHMQRFECQIKAVYRNKSNNITNCVLYNTGRTHDGVEVDQYKVFISQDDVFLELQGHTKIQNKTHLEATLKNCLSSPHLDIFECSYPFHWRRFECHYK